MYRGVIQGRAEQGIDLAQIGEELSVADDGIAELIDGGGDGRDEIAVGLHLCRQLARLPGDDNSATRLHALVKNAEHDDDSEPITGRRRDWETLLWRYSDVALLYRLCSADIPCTRSPRQSRCDGAAALRTGDLLPSREPLL